MKDELTQAQAKELFNYDRSSGKLYWKCKPAPRANRVKIGKEVGNVFCHGQYLQTCVYQRKYLVHRIIWLMEYGEYPKQQIDHIDGCGLNNKLENLRDVADFDNKKNMSRRSDNKSGITGVCWHKKAMKWIAQIQVNGENHYLGLFDSIEGAAIARADADIAFNFNLNHGRE